MESRSAKQKRLWRWAFWGLEILAECNYEFESILQPDKAVPTTKELAA